MEKYTLFIDESKYDQVFSIGGYIIKNNDIFQLDTEMNVIKDDIFNSHNNKIIHMNEIRTLTPTIHSNNGSQYGHQTKVLKNRPYYKVFTKISIQKKLNNNLNSIINGLNIVTISASLNFNRMNKVFFADKKKSHFIAFERLIENFILFLINNNAQGNIIMEDNSLSDYYDMEFLNYKQNGTIKIEGFTVRKYLKHIDFIGKNEDNNPLQLSDVIIEPIAQKLSGNTLSTLNVYKSVKSKLYDGNQGRSDIFGKTFIDF